MPRAYYSSVLSQQTDYIWNWVRDFNNYSRYIDGITESVIEDGKRGDEIGAVRRFCYDGSWIRQRLTAHSDTEYAFSYAGMAPFEFPGPDAANVPAPADYSGTLRLTPVIDGNRTFIEWFVDFDCPEHDATQWRGLLMALIPQWVDSLSRSINNR